MQERRRPIIRRYYILVTNDPPGCFRLNYVKCPFVSEPEKLLRVISLLILLRLPRKDKTLWKMDEAPLIHLSPICIIHYHIMSTRTIITRWRKEDPRFCSWKQSVILWFSCEWKRVVRRHPDFHYEVNPVRFFRYGNTGPWISFWYLHPLLIN